MAFSKQRRQFSIRENDPRQRNIPKYASHKIYQDVIDGGICAGQLARPEQVHRRGGEFFRSSQDSRSTSRLWSGALAVLMGRDSGVSRRQRRGFMRTRHTSGWQTDTHQSWAIAAGRKLSKPPRINTEQVWVRQPINLHADSVFGCSPAFGGSWLCFNTCQ